MGRSSSRNGIVARLSSTRTSFVAFLAHGRPTERRASRRTHQGARASLCNEQRTSLLVSHVWFRIPSRFEVVGRYGESRPRQLSVHSRFVVCRHGIHQRCLEHLDNDWSTRLEKNYFQKKQQQQQHNIIFLNISIATLKVTPLNGAKFASSDSDTPINIQLGELVVDIAKHYVVQV